MTVTDFKFHETPWGATPIRRLGLQIQGSWLEPILEEFENELRGRDIRRVRPKFYLSTEWGVPFGTVAIAIPFYLARKDLINLHAECSGYIEGVHPADLLRYLRHEMGHVINYAYRLYEEEEWIRLFGSITQPYVEEYRPEPFSQRYVRHLPGWYAQKHPDEDWAETFAVWLTPDLDWRAEYRSWPVALAKLEYCDRSLSVLRDRDPVASEEELDEDVGELTYSVEEFYRSQAAGPFDFPPGLDGALRTIFDDLQLGKPTGESQPASQLIRRLERDLMVNVFRWTGHFPERTQALLRHLATRADQLKQVYPEAHERPATVSLTTLVTALAMNYVQRGSYQS